LCDKLLLRDNCDQDIVGKIKYILTIQPTVLQPVRLRAAARLPSGHGIRKLFANAAVKDSVLTRKRRKAFRFEAQLRELWGEVRGGSAVCVRWHRSEFCC
jgi:hypothetical protein